MWTTGNVHDSTGVEGYDQDFTTNMNDLYGFAANAGNIYNFAVTTEDVHDIIMT